MLKRVKKLLAVFVTTTMVMSAVSGMTLYNTSAETTADETSPATEATTEAEPQVPTVAPTETTEPAPIRPAQGDENIIDYSFPNLAGYGFTFGVVNNETRWQTFTATKSGAMEAIEVVLLKKNAQTVATPDITAYLYSVENNLPTSILAQVTVPGAQLKSATPGTAVNSDMISRFPLSYNLVNGQKYAIVLESAVVGERGDQDQCYDWFTSNIGLSGVEYFGKSSGASWIDESFLGTAWLKVFYQTEPENIPDPIDYTFAGTGNGYGFGATGNEYRWQTFTAAEDCNLGSVELKVTKFAHNAESQIDQINDLIVELRTVSNNRPDELLLRKIVPADSIISKESFTVDLPQQLTGGETYAIAMTMARPFSAHGGYDCYGWTTSQNPNATGQFFGKSNTTQDQNYSEENFNWVDESFLGAGWMKVNFVGSTPGPVTPVATTISATAEKTILEVNETSQLSVVVKDQFAEIMPSATITYTSSEESIATVSDTGLITALSGGAATITVASGSINTKVTVAVAEADGTIVPVPGMVIDQSITLKPGEYDFAGADKGLIVTGNNITIDGNGAIIRNSPLEETVADVTSGAYALELTPAAGQSGYSISRQFHFGSASSIKLAFDARGAGFTGDLLVQASTNGTDWNTLHTTAVAEEWGHFEVDLSAYSGQSVYLRFFYQNAGAIPEGMTLKIDTVEVFENGVRTFSELFESKPFYWWDISYGDGVRVADSMRGKPFDRTAYTIDRSRFKGVGLTATGVNGVTIENLTLAGFYQAMSLANSSNLTVKNNLLSNNYTDPLGGWGNQNGGALILNHVQDSNFTGNIAQNNADGLVLLYSNGNSFSGNNFSVNSDVSLQLEDSSFNSFIDNDFSWGVRIDAYEEVHARDSTSQLMESGSNYNLFQRNDFTHGGDGIFIRVLNGWSCEGNFFVENDTSFANNNAVESWAGRNYYIGNKANYSSYGFWLGGSDESVVYGNEAAYNGISPHNAPEAFGNAGIAIVNGSGEHIKIENNNIHDNYGPGIALRYNADYPTHHYIIQNNRITGNKTSPYNANHVGYAIYLNNGDWFDISGNLIEDNSSNTVYKSSTVTNVFERTSPYYASEAEYEAQKPIAKITASADRYVQGEEITFSAQTSTDPNGKPLSYRWDMGDGTILAGSTVTYAFQKTGYYDVAVTVSNGALGDLAWLNCNVVAAGAEIGTESPVSEWLIPSNSGKTTASLAQPATSPLSDMVDFLTYFVIDGNQSLKLDSYAANSKLTYPASQNAAYDFSTADALSFSMRVLNEGNDFSSYKAPLVKLATDANNSITFTPTKSWLSTINAATYGCNQYRTEWTPVMIPFSGNGDWQITRQGEVDFANINYIEITALTGGGHLQMWLDGMKTVSIPEAEYYANMAVDATATASSTVTNTDAANPLSETPNQNLFWQSEPGAESWYQADFDELRVADRIDFYYRYLPTGDDNLDIVALPEDFKVEYMKTDGTWAEVTTIQKSSVRPGQNQVTFEPVKTEGLRLIFTNAAGKATALYSFQVYNTQNFAAQRSESREPLTQVSSSIIQSATLQSIEVPVLINDASLWPSYYGDLEAYVYQASADGKGPSGAPLAKGVLQKTSITTFGIPYTITMGAIGGGEAILEPGQRYVVLLTQNPMTYDNPETRNVHYRWPISALNGVRGQFYGKVTNNDLDDVTSFAQEFTNAAWLKVHTDKDRDSQATIDFSWSGNPTGGFGVGHQGENSRYQTFDMPADSVQDVIDGSTKKPGWETQTETENSITMTFDSRKTIRNVNIFFEEGHVAQSLKILADGQVIFELAAPQPAAESAIAFASVETLAAGFNSIDLEAVEADALTFVVTSAPGETVIIKEIEVMSIISPSSEITPTPTVTPTVTPTITPTVAPTGTPTGTPTVAPTGTPTGTPTVAPTVAPIVDPTGKPTSKPTATPTKAVLGTSRQAKTGESQTTLWYLSVVLLVVGSAVTVVLLTRQQRRKKETNQD